MAEAFTATGVTVAELLGPYQRQRVVVPPFQRGYMWQAKKHVLQFWKDISRFQNRRFLQSQQKRYFLGPIVILSKPDDESLYLLDGQQRLATATILLSVIRDLAASVGSEAGKMLSRDIHANLIEHHSGFALELGETDAAYFRETIQTAPSSNRKPALRTHHNIKNAKKILTDCVKAHIGQLDPLGKLNSLRTLADTLAGDLMMARIPVYSEGEAFQIFETLNDRGLKLQAPDLLLNYLMSMAPPEARKEVRDSWTDMITRIGNEDINDFLRCMWVSRFGDLKDQSLFDALKDHIEVKQVRSVTFVADCSADCDWYMQLLTLDAEHIHKHSIDPLRRLLHELGAEATLPLLLAAHTLLLKSDFELVVRSLLVFYTQYSIISNLDRGDMAELFYSLALSLRSHAGEQISSAVSRNAALEIKATLMSNAPSSDDIAARLKRLDFDGDSREARYVVGRLATYIQSPTKELQLDEVTLEHVYPLNPHPNEWGGEANQAILNEYAWHLGNLTIYGTRINNKSRNKEYAFKRNEYAKKSKVEMTLDIAKTYGEWSEHTIISRGERLAKQVLQIWNFANPSRV